MRIEQLSQTARGLRDGTSSIAKEKIVGQLQRVKWFLWHGNVNVTQADETLSALIDDADEARAEDHEGARPAPLALKKLSRALDEFGNSK